MNNQTPLEGEILPTSDAAKGLFSFHIPSTTAAALLSSVQAFELTPLE